ncbi:Hint domain-containing protein [Acidisoma cellulosilytica]|uniref:Hint domain-containing protein n=1 Tax=Acidisoma cellulosilyticum TaxID=2802395 RepID=A0A964E6W4_9PROT|nr:Hint domain-containing protein [Acidisoma cellulosilyticum]MCB8884009.1 Hint domain-containing protein [Acidisoma cellulosilyticum]
MPTDELTFSALLNRMSYDFDLILTVDAHGLVTDASGTIISALGQETTVTALQDTVGNNVTFDQQLRLPDQRFVSSAPYADTNGIGFSDSSGNEYDLFSISYIPADTFITYNSPGPAYTARYISLEPNCYLSGTRIKTAEGSICVENLVIGDTLLTIDGVSKPVKWIGHRHVDCKRHPVPTKVLPVEIQTNAFGSGLPGSSLFLSPDHGVFVEGVLIPIKHLINGTTIRQVKVETLTYFHIELEEHSIIFAEGLPCETYLESGQRCAFDNSSEATTFHPQFEPHPDQHFMWESVGFAPLVVSGPLLSRTRAAIARQSAAMASGICRAA